MAEITPRSVGRVQGLIGTPLRADLELPEGEELASFEIELVPGRKGARSRAWKEPTWRFDSELPSIDAIDEHPAHEEMAVERRRPAFRVTSREPFDAYAWRLTQDGEPIESEAKATDGIEPDGTAAEFRPSRRLRRSGRAGRPRRKGVFYPPFDSHLPDLPRTEASRIAYNPLTHAGHSGHDAYSVDFNWRSGEADRGHWVRAAAVGRVSRVDPDNGQVHIRHAGFGGKREWETIYAHLDPILVREGQRVRAYQRLGRIGSSYHGVEVISPHLHHPHLRDGEPVRMRLLLDGEVTPVDVSRRDPDRIQAGRSIPGWERPRGPALAQLAVRTRRAADGEWSGWTELPFVVTRTGAPAIAEHDDAFGSDPEGAHIMTEYAGPTVEPGEYTLRYRARGDAGTTTPWAYDQSIVVEPALA